MKNPKPTLEQAREELEKGRTFLKTAEYAKAIEVLEAIAPIFEEAEDWEGYVDCLNCCCEGFWQNQRLEAAEKKVYIALSVSEKKIGDHSIPKAKSLSNLGVISSLKSDFNQSIIYSTKSLKIFEKILGRFNRYTATAVRNIGNNYWRKGDFNKAIKNLEKSLEIALHVFEDSHPMI